MTEILVDINIRSDIGLCLTGVLFAIWESSIVQCILNANIFYAPEKYVKKI